MVEVGDKIRFVPSGLPLMPGEERKRALTGTVFQVNHEHRHYGVVAETGVFGHKIRESFKF